MQLFSKRNGDRYARRFALRHADHSAYLTRQPNLEQDRFISDPLRNRLKEQLKYIVGSNKFLEPFLIVNSEKTGDHYLHKQTLSDLSLREIGYNISDSIDLGDLEFKTEKISDFKFFDLIELIIIFSKPDKREEIIERINTIFKEEKGIFSIHGFMIVSKENDGLRSIIPLIKEKNLQEKIKSYYEQRLASSVNYEFLARISADIIQLLFSSPLSKSKTKKFANGLCIKVAESWTEKTKVKELAGLISETVKNAKDLSNQISNVRHTDRTTIPVDSPNFYKLISSKNINLAELVILSLPELFIMEQDPEGLKNSYLKKYQVDKDVGWTIKKKDQGSIEYPEEDIDPKDIPF